MNSLFGKWISVDGFCLNLLCHPGGRIEGVYQTSLLGKTISLEFHGVSLNRKDLCTFVAVVECEPCQDIGWTGEITISGTLDKSKSRMKVKWLTTSGLTELSQNRQESITGKSLLLKFPQNFPWDPGANSEHYAPHTLLVHECTRLVQGTRSNSDQTSRQIVAEASRKKKP